MINPIIQTWMMGFKAATYLQRTTLAGICRATHFFAATCLAGVAALTMLVVLLGLLSNTQFLSMAFGSLSQFPSFSIPAQLKKPVPSAWGQAGLGSVIQGPRVLQLVLSCGTQHHGTMTDNAAASNQEANT